MTVGITDKPAVPKGRLVGGKQVLAVEVRGLLTVLGSKVESRQCYLEEGLI